MPPADTRASRVELCFAPASVAIVGASGDPRKWGYMAAEQALRDAARRRVWLVNAKGAAILGHASVCDVRELPAAPDLAIVTVPPAAFEGAIEGLLERGTRAIVAITSGFSEASTAGAEIERRVVARVREAGAVLVGPNCMGVFDGHAPFRCMPWAEIGAGPIGFVSQSGGLIMDLSLRLADARLGLSRAVSLGNGADVDVVDLVGNFGAHARTSLLAVYAESVTDPERFFDVVRGIVRAGKPVVMLSPDSTPAARRGALGHTGSIARDRGELRSAAEAAGAVYAESLGAMSDTLQVLVSGQRARGRRTAIVTDTGGPGVLLAGAAERAGLEVPTLSDALQAQLRAVLTPRAVLGNPIDLVDNLDASPAVDVLDILQRSDEVDAVLMNLHAFVHDTPAQEADVGSRLAQVARRYGKPVVLACRSLTIPGVVALHESRMPVFRDGDTAARMLADLCNRRSPS